MAKKNPLREAGTAARDAAPGDYVLEEQIGFILRRAGQRHSGIFADLINESLTPTQFAALAKLRELESCTQNLLGRRTAMDVATIKGVVDRLTRRGLTRTWPDPTDARRALVGLTDEGRRVIEAAVPRAMEITERTLAPLSEADRKTLLRLLGKLC